MKPTTRCTLFFGGSLTFLQVISCNGHTRIRVSSNYVCIYVCMYVYMDGFSTAFFVLLFLMIFFFAHGFIYKIYIIICLFVHTLRSSTYSLRSQMEYSFTLLLDQVKYSSRFPPRNQVGYSSTILFNQLRYSSS